MTQLDRLNDALGRTLASAQRAAPAACALVHGICAALDTLSTNLQVRALDSYKALSADACSISPMIIVSGAAIKRETGSASIVVERLRIRFSETDQAAVIQLCYEQKERQKWASFSAEDIRNTSSLYVPSFIRAALRALDDLAAKTERRAAELEMVAGGAPQ